MTDAERNMLRFLLGLLGVLCLVDLLMTAWTYGDTPAWLGIVAMGCLWFAFADRIRR